MTLRVHQLPPAQGPSSSPRKSRDSSRARTMITSMVEPEARDSDRPSRSSRPNLWARPGLPSYPISRAGGDNASRPPPQPQAR